ncbi:TonB-dependent receptor [Acidithiobacillus thiooxidans]|uniref:Vitamin B12 transporter BtuB n=1 Tax=Acidithiobacillus thiooxidans ATCC 19377 TaxID=637390 RepID=A0A543Q3F0_ACITH|nr:TonB-dependent receptor [Acidithiobacillus thiooxidans]MDX5935019.1 TonB-dependent receptor [Acidithiobacillus thiooxidans]TQN50855.1 Vitamin B12 transporter BtuB [Acidithiobacillus thiooxidans ATCC 19377]
MPSKPNNPRGKGMRSSHRMPQVSKLLLAATLFAIYPALSSAAFASTANDTTVTKSDNTEKVVKLKEIKKKYERLLVGERNIASAMSVIGPTQIKHASSAESIYSLLKQTPSVNEYQQNVGPGTPVLTVRGVRMSQLAQTLDGIPMTSLLSGGQGAYLNNNVGTVISNGQISGIHVYPGVAPPDRGGFATVGGTVSYTTKTPPKKLYADIFTKVGSFSTDTYGFDASSGKIPGTDGLRVYTRLSQTQTDGYIQNTPARYTDFLFTAIKPYDYGLSKVTGTVIYNTAHGYLISAPNAVAQLDKYGIFYNYPLSEASTLQKNQYLTAILGDSTYINSHLVIGAKAFFIHKHSYLAGYLDPSLITQEYPYQVNFNNPYSGYGPLAPTSGGPGLIPHTYNPVAVFGSYHAGEAAQINISSSNTIGIAPKINIFLPHNDITVGGLIAQETSGPGGGDYFYGSLDMPEIYGYNSYGDPAGKAQRTVYSGYVSDKINLINNRLHIEPGVTLTGVSTSNYVPANLHGTPPNAYTLSNYDKEILPYLGLSYDITHKVIAYASYGKGARFAPVADYVLGPSGSTTLAPGPETVNAYETGLRYVGKHLYVNFDGFLQNMHGMFSFYTNYLTGYSLYANIGEEQMKGLELSGKYEINPEWTVSGHVSYTDAQYMNSFSANVTPFEGQYGYVFAGDPLASVPNWLAGLRVGYHNHNFHAALIESYTGPQVTTYDLPPTESNPLLQDATTPNPGVKLAPYFLTNLQASYKVPIHEDHLSSVTVSLNIDNLLDNHYYLHYYQAYKEYAFEAVGDPYAEAYPGMPRFIELGLSGRFS